MIYLAVFVLALLMELLFARWTMEVQARRIWGAAFTSGAIQVPLMVGTFLIVGDLWCLLPNVFGHALGSYVAVKWLSPEGPNA